MSIDPFHARQERGPLLRRGSFRLFTACLTAATLTSLALAAPAQAQRQVAPQQPWMNTDLAADQRADLLVAEMTLEEKITLVTGPGAGSRYDRRGVPRLGIPPVDNADSGLGLSLSDGTETTSFPSGLAMASTLDPELVREQGRALGAEAWQVGINELLGPTIDLHRSPWNGRAFEAFGEDPYLLRQMAEANISGIQENPVLAAAKHYNVNTQETDRYDVDEQLSERALRETFTPAWEGAVDADVAGAMCSFNQVNGVSACENEELLTEILKGDLGFEGFVLTDYNANQSTVRSANAGLDFEGPDPVYWGSLLQDAVESGEVPIARLDDMVDRLLSTYIKRGLFDDPARGLFDDPVARQPVPAAMLASNDALSQQIAEKGAVLLKNDGDILPLDDAEIGSVAVIGADADYNIQGAGSAAVRTPPEVTTMLEGITERATGEVVHVDGTDPVVTGDMLAGPAPIPSAVLAPVGGQPGARGLRGEYFLGGAPIGGTPQIVRTEPQVNVLAGLTGILGLGLSQSTLPPALIAPGANWDARYTGTLTPPTTGEYTLSVTHWGSARLVVDGQEVIDAAGPDANTVSTATVPLQAGVPVSVLLEYVSDEPSIFQGPTGPQVRLGWIPPAGTVAPDIQEAAAVAAEHDVAIVVVRDYNSEASDRGDLSLPQNQDQLISSVVAANPNTVVLASTGGAVLMPWLDEVPAVLQTWYAGQQQGRAAARLLYGDVNPGGKLPITFPTGEREHPISTVEQWPGVNGVALHSEDVFVGYRGYQELGIEPLFPFGFGLSYDTEFAYSDLSVATRPTPERTLVDATFTVTNTGSRRGSDVPQVYVGELPAPVPTPPMQLAGFSRVDLAPGESTTLTVELSEHALEYWGVEQGAWVTAQGAVDVHLARSVDDVQLTTELDTEPASEPAPDTTAPSLELAGITDGGSYGNAGTIDWGFSTDDPQATVVAALDGASVDLTRPLPLWTLAVGRHQLVVTVTDLAGNSTRRTFEFTVSTSFADLGALVQDFQGAGLIDRRDAGKLRDVLARAERLRGNGNATVAQLRNFRRDVERQVADRPARAALVRSADALIASQGR